MNIYENWQAQKEELARSLSCDSNISGDIYQIRHAILQTEQRSMGECENDTLRQQAGVLFAVVKNSLPMLDAVQSGRIWQEVSSKPQKKRTFRQMAGWAAVLLCLVSAALLWLKNETVFSIISFLPAVLFAVSLLADKQKPQTNDDEMRVSLKLSPDKLLSALDSQFQSLDRYLTDFQYLNDSLGTDSEGIPDARTVQRAKSLLQALYGMDEKDEDAVSAMEGAKGLLTGLGFQWLDYTAENKRYFSVLPSRSFTKTLCPALFSLKDGSLLSKGQVVLPFEN